MYGVYTYQQFREMNSVPKDGYMVAIRITHVLGDEVIAIMDGSSESRISIPYILNLVTEGRAIVTNPSALKNWLGFKK